MSAGTATTRPARGPAAAMSKSALRSRAGERMRMMAPKVPNSMGGRDEVRQADRRPVVARREVVAELVHAEDGQQGDRERRAADQPARERQRPVGVERLRADEERGAGHERGQQGQPRTASGPAAAAPAASDRRAARPARRPRRPRPARTACSRSGAKRASSVSSARAVLGPEPAVEQDDAAPDLALLHLEHVLGGEAQPLLGGQEILGGEPGRHHVPPAPRPQTRQEPHAISLHPARTRQPSPPRDARPPGRRRGRGRRARPRAWWPGWTRCAAAGLLGAPAQPQQRARGRGPPPTGPGSRRRPARPGAA